MTAILNDFFQGDCPEIADVSHDERLELVVELERLRHWVDATIARALAVMADEPEPLPDVGGRAQPGEFLRDEDGLAVGWSFGVAHDRITAAQTLVHVVPTTLAAVEAGELSYLKAQHLAKAVRGCDPLVAAAIEARVLPRGRVGRTSRRSRRRSRGRCSRSTRPTGTKGRRPTARSQPVIATTGWRWCKRWSRRSTR